VTLWCPRCVAPVLEHAVRCAVCGADLRADLHATPAAPAAASDTPEAPEAPDGHQSAAPRLAPRLAEEAATGPARRGVPGALLRALALALAALLVVGVLVGLAAAAAAVGYGGIAWPALAGVGIAALLAGLTQLERRRSLRRSARSRTDQPDAGAAPTDLELAHLFAARFARPASRGDEAFWPPLAARPVDAAEAAWRAIAATLLDLAEADVVELEPRALPTPGKPVAVVGVRLVRPLPGGDAFAAQLVRPLARRGVGGSTLLSDLVAHLGLPPRQPARALLDSARERLTARGYYGAGGDSGWHGVLRGVLLLPPPPAAARIAAARPALDALEARLDDWDARDPSLAATLRHEVRAGLLRTRMR
jgi:hypothetical protein